MKKQLFLLLMLISLLGAGTQCENQYIKHKQESGNKICEVKMVDDILDAPGSNTSSSQIISKLCLTQMGRGVNLVTGNPLAYKEENPVEYDIFDRTWLDSYYSKGTVLSTNSYTHVVSEMSNSVEDIANKIRSDKSLNSNFNVSYLNYKAELETNFGLVSNNSLVESMNKILYSYIYTRSKYTYTLPDIYNSEIYLNHLNPSYVCMLETALKSDSIIDYANLFDTYGTHILVGAKFGGAYDVFYSACSKSIDFDSEFSVEIKNKLEGAASIEEAGVAAGVTSEFNMASELKKHTYSLVESTKANFYGGSANGTTGSTEFKGIVERASKWVETVDDETTIVKYSQLMPIWDMLPDKYIDKRQSIKNAYVKYSKINDDKYYEKPNIIGTLRATQQVIQPSSQITCGDYWDVRRDYFTTPFDLKNNSSLYDFEEVKKQGYKKIKIKLFFKALKDGRSGSYISAAVKIGNSQYKSVANNVIANYGEVKDCKTIEVQIEDLISNGTMITVTFSSNNRGAAFLHWDERECVFTDVYFQITYLK